jgi:hypothetical protein
MKNVTTIPIELQLTAKSVALIEALRKIDQEPSAAEPAAATAMPAIGSRTHGGIYAGLFRGEDGAPDAHIILLDDTPGKDLNWADAVKWAEGLGDGARLPTRFESALLYANVHDQLVTDEWHWTGTQVSAGTSWMQYFSHGSQFTSYKLNAGRARAVRRLNSLVL